MCVRTKYSGRPRITRALWQPVAAIKRRCLARTRSRTQVGIFKDCSIRRPTRALIWDKFRDRMHANTVQTKRITDPPHYWPSLKALHQNDGGPWQHDISIRRKKEGQQGYLPSFRRAVRHRREKGGGS